MIQHRYIEKFGRPVTIDSDHPLALAQDVLDQDIVETEEDVEEEIEDDDSPEVVKPKKKVTKKVKVRRSRK